MKLVMFDCDSSGRLVNINIDDAANEVELQRLILSKLQGKIERHMIKEEGEL